MNNLDFDHFDMEMLIYIAKYKPRERANMAVDGIVGRFRKIIKCMATDGSRCSLTTQYKEDIICLSNAGILMLLDTELNSRAKFMVGELKVRGLLNE